MKKALKYTKMLDEVGLTREQAEVHLNILSDVFEEDLATKADIDNLHLKIDLVDSSLSARMDKMESRLDAKIDALGARLDARIDALDLKIDTCIEKLEQKMTIKLGSIVIAANATMLTLFKFVL